jgi:hypothetical protein
VSGYKAWAWGKGLKIQGSTQPLAAGAASLIEKETSLEPEKSLKIL